MALARQHQRDLILLDLHLPDVNGEDLLRELRGDPRTAASRVVVISADATPNRVRDLRNAGAMDYLTKLIDVSRLVAHFDAALENGSTKGS